MKRSRAIHLTLVASVAALLTDCSHQSTRYCVDQNQNTTDDWRCDDHDNGYRWYYSPRAHIGNGVHLSSGSYVPPPAGYISRSGAHVEGTARGGIGAAGEAAGGGHGSGGGE